MKIVFVSNFFNHHQEPLSTVFSSNSEVDFTFIETEKMSEERLKLGWGKNDKPDYVKSNYADEKKKSECQQLIDEADIVIWGDAPKELFKRRLKEGRLTFLYHERIYKKGYQYYKLPTRVIRHFFKYNRYKNLYLLCASSYASADFAKTGCFLGKAFKWGYFTEFKEYDDIDKLINEKKKNSILWVARFIDWKHPELPIQIAKMLRSEGYQFDMNLIGNGVLMHEIGQMIKENTLDDCVHLLGSMQPHEVRRHMENSELFLFTSDKNEGWGAVANEAMNSGCAVIGSHAIGSVPFLITDGDNGFIYHDGDIDDIYAKVKHLLDNPEKRTAVSQKAYKTIAEEWNAKVAADKFFVIAQELLQGKKAPFFSKGVCSKAQHLSNNWIDKKAMTRF